ncbi:MAG: hypothetical protein IKD21_06140 [Clostridia bacterium]|nr:hypothetical protein [Clostridia bacterium]
MKDVRKQLGIQIESPFWDEAYQKALLEPMVPEWMTEGYVRRLHEECGIFPENLEVIVSAISYVARVPELCLLAKTMYHILATKQKFEKAFSAFELPVAPAGTENTIGYDCFSVFPILAHLRPTWDEFQNRGVGKSVLTDSLHWVDSLFTDSSKKAGKPAFTADYFRLYGVSIYTNHLTIGRLRFEIYENSSCPARIFANHDGDFCILMDHVMLHKSGQILGSYACVDEDGAYAADFLETEDFYEGYAVDKGTCLAQNVRTALPKKDWLPVYASGDHVIRVHIPYGGKLDKTACEASYQKARELFGRCYPEINFTGFLICCWMLSPVLKRILPPTSNIVAFQEQYHIFPSKSSAADAFLYVFGIEETPVSAISLSELPEENALMCGVKEESLQGNYIHQFNGFFLW